MRRAGVHGALVVVWSLLGLVIMVLPSLRGAVPLVQFESLYAIVVAHAVGAEAKLAKDAARENNGPSS